MNFKRFITSMVLMAAAILLPGCSDDDPVIAPKVPSLNLNSEVVEAAAEGGEYSVGYTITDPVTGGSLAPTCDAEWITLNSATDGKIAFTVAANETAEAREAVVKVGYTNIETPATFTVKQAAAAEKPTPEPDPEPTPDPEITLNAAEVNVPCEGGAAEMAYTLTNPVEGAALKATTTAEWITNLNTEVADKITFTVAANEQTAPRSAEVELTYPNIKDPIRFTVKQEAAPEQPQSQNEITIEISKITDKSVYLKFTPSNNTPYTAGLIPSYKLNGKTTDEEIINFIINEFGPYPFNDVFEAEVRPLESDTEYYVFAFGYDANKKKATSKLHHKTFNTLIENNEVCDIKIVLEYGEYADAQSVGAIDSNYGSAIDPSTSALVPFKAYTIPEGHEVFWYILDPSALDLSKESLIETLINGGGFRSSKVLQLDYGTTFVGLAVAEDEKGRPGELFIGKELTLTPEGVMPAEEFVKKYPFKSTNQMFREAAVKRPALTASEMLLGR